MSTPMKCGAYGLAPLSVCLSICLSVRHAFVSVSFELLVGFTNNTAQIPSMMTRCTVQTFDQVRFKVKVMGY